MPQIAHHTDEMIWINEPLGIRSCWPILCNLLRPMRTPLCDPKTREKEVREFPMGLAGLGSKSARKSFRDVSKDRTKNQE